MAATLEGLQFELERRVILFKPTTTMPDLSQLGYNADPNLIVTPGDPLSGTFLLYNCPNNTRYVNYDPSGNTITEWYKHSHYWLPLGGVSGIFVKESSIGYGLAWDSLGYLDVSINAGPTLLSYDTSIFIDGSTNIFSVIHNLGTLKQVISIWDVSSGTIIYPEIIRGASTNIISISPPLDIGANYDIVIMGF